MSDRLYVVPYDFFGVKLFAVESEGGYIHKYCDCRSDADSYIKKQRGDESELEQPEEQGE